MDHKEVIPASHQEYNDNFEETEEEEDKGEVEDDDESMTTTSEIVYSPLLPDGEEQKEQEDVDVEDMESLEDEEACPLTPLLSYRQRDNMYFSENERQGPCQRSSVERNGRKAEERKEEERKEEEVMEEKTDDEDSLLGLVIPLVSIVITQPTPEIERRTLEGWLEEQEQDEDDELVDLVAEDDDEEKGDNNEGDKEKIRPNSEAGNATKPIGVGSNMELSEETVAVPSIIVTPVTPELNQKIFEIESDEREDEAKEEEIVKANPDSLEKGQVKSGIKFSEDVKADDGDKDDKGGGARMRRRSSLFSTVTKATSILR